MSNKYHAERKVYDFVDIVLFVRLFIYLLEVFAHEFEHIHFEIIKFIYTDFCVKNAL